MFLGRSTRKPAIDQEAAARRVGFDAAGIQRKVVRVSRAASGSGYILFSLFVSFVPQYP